MRSIALCGMIAACVAAPLSAGLAAELQGETRHTTRSMVCDTPKLVAEFARVIAKDTTTPDEEIIATINKNAKKAAACIQAEMFYRVGKLIRTIDVGDEKMEIREVWVQRVRSPRTDAFMEIKPGEGLQYGLFSAKLTEQLRKKESI